MHLSVFGLSITSSWGNGHATLWRGLVAALAARGVKVTFYERDTPYYAAHRDAYAPPAGCRVVVYDDGTALAAIRAATRSDAVLATSYCVDAPTALAAAGARGVRTAFYDLDAPVTLMRRRRGDWPAYLPANGYADVDVVFSYAAGPAPELVRAELGARRCLALPGFADPARFAPSPARDPRYAASYVGAFAEDRAAAVDELFFEVARARPAERFLLAGAGYDGRVAWSPGVDWRPHADPGELSMLFSWARLTLNVTRADMRAIGWAPSGRIFEAGACGAAVVSDAWPGITDFFTPGHDILVAHTPTDMHAALDRGEADLRQLGAALCETVMSRHTAQARAQTLLAGLELQSPDASAPTREAAACGA